MPSDRVADVVHMFAFPVVLCGASSQTGQTLQPESQGITLRSPSSKPYDVASAVQFFMTSTRPECTAVTPLPEQKPGGLQLVRRGIPIPPMPAVFENDPLTVLRSGGSSRRRPNGEPY